MQSNWIYLMLLICVCSCNNAPEDRFKTNSEVLETHQPARELSKEDAYLALITQKLQEQLDIEKLKENHPEFVASNLSLGVFNTDIDSSAVLLNVDLLESNVQMDTTFIKLSVTLEQSQEIKMDTVFAMIVSKNIEIDKENVLSTEISLMR